MKRKFTFLIAAAVMLLTMVATTGTMWGQTTVTQTSFTATSGNVNNDTKVSYAAYKGGGTSNPAVNSNAIRLYQNSNGATGGYIVIGVSEGYVITSATIQSTMATTTGYKLTDSDPGSTTPAKNTFNVSDYSLSANTDYTVGDISTRYIVFACFGTSSSSRLYLSKISITYQSTGGGSTPSISANDVDLAYNATSGSIAYTLNNATGSVSAEITNGDWLTLGEITASEVPFTCSANTGAERTATVTLSFEGATDKVVTVTQAALPETYTTIPALFTGATSTETPVFVTFDNWVVSGVSTNGKNVYVTDGTNGFIIYYNSDMSSTFSAGNILSGENVSCTLKLYSGAAELLNVDAEDLTITAGGTVTPANIELANLTGVNTGALLHYDGLTCTFNNNKYYLTDGTTSIQLYNSLYNFTAPTVGNTYNITGVYVQFNNTKEIMPRSAADLVEVVLPTVATPTFSPVAGTYTSVQNVTIACVTDDATIYYTTNGNDPTTSSTLYTEPIVVAETKTIKAIAVKDGMIDSEIATAAYTINLPVPTITVAPANVDIVAAGVESTLTATYTNMGDVEDIIADIAFYESDGTTTATYDWITANIKNDDNTVVEYLALENEGAARTAYLKVYGTTDGDHFTYSNLVTISQAAPTYAVTFDVDGGTFIPNADFATINEEKTAGTYNLPSATKDNYEFVGWSDGTTTYAANEEYTISAAVNFTAQWTLITTGTIVFGNNGTKINGTSVTGDDSFGNTWTITTVGTSSFTQNAAYSQVGASSSPATSITFTTTLAQSTTFTAFSAKFGGFGGTAGTVTMKVGETTVGTGSLNGTTDIVVENTLSATGTVLTVTVTDIAKGVKCYYISYTISTGSDPMIVAQNSIELSSTDTYGEFDYSIVNPGTGQLTASSTNEWISNINVTAEKVTFVTTPNTSTTDDREGTITLSYPNATNKDVTVTQSKVDYATMPFAFDGGKNYLPIGLTGTLGNDYGSSPKLGFRNTGDNLILKLNEAPVSIIYDIKGNSFSGGTFKVQVSADGTTYNDLKEYTTLGDTQTDTLINNTNTVRYIKWIYTNKSNGNVALGNIQVYDVEFTIIKNNAIINDLTIADGTAYVVENGVVLTLTGTVSNTNPANLIIEDGGQLIYNGSVQATMKKSTAHAGSKAVGDWYTIASPLNETVTTTSSNTNLTTGLDTDEYDLYRYNETSMKWENSKAGANSTNFTNIEAGRGYLYWREDGADLVFAGELRNNDVNYALTAGSENDDLKGFNLIGNPFSQNITMSNITGATLTGGYVLTQAGAWGASVETTIAPCQGFLVQVDAAKNIIISKTPAGKSRANRNYIAFTIANSQYEDVTYAMFEEGLGLNKINHRNASIPMLYIAQNEENYAIATMSEETQSFNLNFKAMTTGQYTLSYKAEGNYDYLHVIDRLTGEDVDMLLDGEYSFIASPSDNDARFIVKLGSNANGNAENDIFAYQDGSDIVVNGEGELQVFDMMGRMIATQHINGVQTVNMPSNGVYIFKLNEKTQKIVVR